MAIGSQLQNGNWALFVIAARTTKMANGAIGCCLNRCHEPDVSITAMPTMMATSPMRLVSAVISPAPTE